MTRIENVHSNVEAEKILKERNISFSHYVNRSYHQNYISGRNVVAEYHYQSTVLIIRSN